MADNPQDFFEHFQKKGMDSPGESSGRMSASSNAKKSTVVWVGKQRGGGRILPTGIVKKQIEDPEKKGGSESGYLKEVRRYQEKMCYDEPMQRSLVK